jgi:hypothetical protein
MTQEEQLEQIKKQYVGKRVKIIEPGHPWINELGVFEDIQYFGGVNKWAVIVRLIEYDNEVAVFSGGRGIKVI